MAEKPRITLRIDPGVLELLEWYARARAIPTAELASEFVAAGVAEGLCDADMRQVITSKSGPPPEVPLAVLAGRPPQPAGGIAGALAELRALGEELVSLSPAAAGRIRLASSRVEAHLVLLRDALDERDVSRRITRTPPADWDSQAPASTPLSGDRVAQQQEEA